MPNFDNPNPTNEASEMSAVANQGSSEAMDNAKQDKLLLISKIDNPKLKTLANAELEELEALEFKKA